MMIAKRERVILYSVSLHTWEVWETGRPIAHGRLEACQWEYPEAIPPDERQLRLAAEDHQRRG